MKPARYESLRQVVLQTGPGNHLYFASGVAIVDFVSTSDDLSREVVRISLSEAGGILEEVTILSAIAVPSSIMTASPQSKEVDLVVTGEGQDAQGSLVPVFGSAVGNVLVPRVSLWAVDAWNPYLDATGMHMDVWLAVAGSGSATFRIAFQLTAVVRSLVATLASPVTYIPYLSP